MEERKLKRRAQVAFLIEIHPNNITIDPCEQLRIAMENSQNSDESSLSAELFQTTNHLHDIPMVIYEVEVEKDGKVKTYDLLTWRDGRTVQKNSKTFYGYWALLLQKKLNKHFFAFLVLEAKTSSLSG